MHFNNYLHHVNRTPSNPSHYVYIVRKYKTYYNSYRKIHRWPAAIRSSFDDSVKLDHGGGAKAGVISRRNKVRTIVEDMDSVAEPASAAGWWEEIREIRDDKTTGSQHLSMAACLYVHASGNRTPTLLLACSDTLQESHCCVTVLLFCTILSERDLCMFAGP